MIIIVLMLLTVGIVFIWQARFLYTAQQNKTRMLQLGYTVVTMTMFLLVIAGMMIYDQSLHGAGH